MGFRFRLLALGLLAVSLASAQSTQPASSLNLIMPTGAGRIVVDATHGWQPTNLGLYDANTRPVLSLRDPATKIALSYALFPNPTSKPTAASCRESILAPVLESVAEHATITARQDSTLALPDGRQLAVAAYTITTAASVPINQRNVFGFLGTKDTCAEIHLSHTGYLPSDDARFHDLLEHFTFHPAYTPTAQDYGAIATIFFRAAEDYTSAAVYYRRALDTLPPAQADADHHQLERVLTDQLAISYGMAGDLQRSRAVAQAGIDRDPTYPLNYYNLACADAEEGNTQAAEDHLQQAFARRANVLPGETLPNPAEDPSFQKLRNDPAFVTFLRTLPKA